MNLLIIYLDKDKADASRLLGLLKDKEFVMESLPLTQPEKGGISLEVQLGSYFAKADPDPEEEDPKTAVNPTHVLIASALPSRCFDFLAGYSCASNMPFLVFGENALKGIPNDFYSCFTPLGTEAALLQVFHDQKESYLRIETEKEYAKAREKLLEQGIPVNLESLANCAAKGRIHEIALFLAAGFSPDACNEAGVPLLNIAARRGNQETLRLLLQSGARLDALSEDRGSTALIDSLIGNHGAITKELIKAGANVNVINSSGQTALIVAVGAGDSEIVEALLKAGADPDQVDSMGVSARKYAKLFHKEHMIDLFDTIAPPKAE